MNSVLYSLGNNLYLNITNRCTNRCVFCIKNFTNKVGNEILLLDKEPSLKEIIDSLERIDFTNFEEIVFCGFGEPLIRVEIVKEVAKYIKKNLPSSFIRIDTNGHGNVFNRRNILPEISPYIDAISISLNAENAMKYEKLCRPVFQDAYSYVLDFITQATSYIKDITLSVVNVESIDLDKCKEIANNLKVNFKIREFTKSL